MRRVIGKAVKLNEYFVTKFLCELGLGMGMGFFEYLGMGFG